VTKPIDIYTDLAFAVSSAH